MQATELMAKIASGTAPTVVDVRTGFEFKRGHIPGACHAPTWKILLRLVKLQQDRERELVLLCELGPRAKIAKGLVALLGYRNTRLLEGHMAAWRRLGLPLEK
jgi:rhodanese-related sulfurtransferase